ncbi:MAG: phosphoribosyltransferase family protein, partial [Nitrosospira sp.]
CKRIKDTASQAGLPWKEREKNIRGAFTCETDLAGKHIAVLDDVMTTGATLNELAKVLRKHGATRVSGWVVARTLSHVLPHDS